MLKKKKPIIVKEPVVTPKSIVNPQINPSVTPEPVVEKPVVISDECRCLAKGQENEALCENRDRDVDDCLSKEGKCLWGPERQECQDQVPKKPIVEEKPETVIEEKTVVKPAENAIDDLIKSGLESQTFQNCNILGWTPTVNAMFVRLCPFGMQMGGKMML